MELPTALRQRIINLYTSQKMNENNLSTKAGIANSTLNSFMVGKSNDPKMSTILHLCEGLNISLSEFFNDPLFDDVIFENDKEEISIK